MPNKNYQRGRAYEYKVMKDYRNAGWIAARTAGSHGPFDVIAVYGLEKLIPWYVTTPTRRTATWFVKMGDVEVRLIQCKTRRKK